MQVRAGSLALIVVLTGCTAAQPLTSTTDQPTATTGPVAASTTTTTDASVPTQPPTGGVDMILVGGKVVTMSDRGEVEAMAIEGNMVAAVGSEPEIMSLAGGATRVIDLEERVVFPGFIDAHSHWYQPNRIGDYGPEQINQVLLSRGWTGTNDVNIEPHFAEQFFAWHRDGRIDLRMNAYLSLNTPGTDQDRHMDWFSAYDLQPAERIGERLAIPGVKIFIASDWDRVVKWTREELTDVVRDYHAAGWQIAAKQINDESLDLAIAAFGAVHAPGDDRRHRLEHALEMRSDQVEEVAELGLVPVVQLGAIESDMRSDPGFVDIIADDGIEAVWPFQDMLAAGLPLVGSIAVVPLEGMRSPFSASVMQMIHGAVTGISEVGAEPWPRRETQLMSVYEALDTITWRAAWATFEEDSRGSLSEGMLADFVVMSDDLQKAAQDPEMLREVSVDATFIDGQLLWCGFGLDDWCESFGQPLPERLLDESTLAPLLEGDLSLIPDEVDFEGMTVTASASNDSHPPELAFDGIETGDSFWSSGTDAPGWLQVEFSAPMRLKGLRFVVFQNPPGDTVHVLEILVDGAWVEVDTFTGFTETGDSLEWANDDEAALLEGFRITTTQSVSWPEWFEIELVD